MNSIMNMLGNVTQQMPKFSPEQISMAKNLLSKKGMSAESMVREICAQRGINVDEFMEQFKGLSS